MKFNYNNMSKALGERTGGQVKRKGSLFSLTIRQDFEIYHTCLS